MPKVANRSVLLLGTLDTKGEEYAFARTRFANAGIATTLVDVGVFPPVGLHPDVNNEVVARAGGSSLQALRESNDRGQAVSIMSLGALKIVEEYYEARAFDGIFAFGGSSGSTIASLCMRALPIGVPKILVSTLAASNAAIFVGESDLAIFASVVDIAGINSVSSRIFSNAIDAMIGMLQSKPVIPVAGKKLIAASMFGVTTTCVTDARRRLEHHGYEVITFHMTGTGGRSMEKLISQGLFHGVLDVTTTELCDEIVGGTLSAGPDRLTAAVKRFIPQVISLGALDMVNFGSRSSVPKKFDSRTLYSHNDNVTLMRTTADECEKIAIDICSKLSKATSPVSLFIPLKGVSAIAVKGAPFFDPAADDALFSTIRENVPRQIDLIELDNAINDPAFSAAMASKLITYVDQGWENLNG